MKTLSALILIIFTFFQATAIADENSSTLYVELNKMGDPAEVLEVKSLEHQVLASGEVRVQVLATPIHPSILLQIAGRYGVDPVLPSVPGNEGVGRVLEVSEEVSHLSVGQLVLLAGGSTWRDEIVAPAAVFVPLPDLGSPSQEVIEQLSMAAVNPLAALLMLDSYVDLQEGDWIVQSAANSAVGGYLIQLAAQRGIKTVNVVRREGLADELKAKGADVVLIDGPDLAEEIKAATEGKGTVLAIDAVGGKTLPRLVDSLAYGGTAVAYGVLSGQPSTINPAKTIFNDVRLRGFWLSKWYQTASNEEKQAAFGKVIPLVASGVLKADVDSRFNVADVKKAVSRAAADGRNGKVLIVPTLK
ncbi:MAG: zinc-dependent alcohol dehydrogenase family protein [Pseudomonadota bacterium]